MSLLERIDTVRDELESLKGDYEDAISDAQSEINTLSYAADVELTVDGGWDFASEADDLRAHADTALEQTGTAQNIADILKRAATYAEKIAELQEELGDDY